MKPHVTSCMYMYVTSFNCMLADLAMVQLVLRQQCALQWSWHGAAENESVEGPRAKRQLEHRAGADLSKTMVLIYIIYMIYVMNL